MLTPAFQPSAPTQIIFQVLGRDPMKASHLLFESTVVCVDVLDVVNPSNNQNSGRQVDRPMGDAELVSHRPINRVTVATQNGVFRQDRA